MLKIDKQKDAKNKQKLDLSKSTQSIAYMVSPLNNQAQQCLNNLVKKHDLQKIETIYQIQMDTETNKQFLKTPYNTYRNKDTNTISYRSPHSHNYYPPINKQDVFLSPFVRTIQQKGSILFNQYAKMYYGDCISNFFVQQSQEQLVFAVYIQKKYKQENSQGIWNSSNIANISGDPSKSITYKITTSVIYQIQCIQDSETMGPFTISGNLKRTKNQSKKLTPDIQLEQLHLTIIGKAIQQNQSYLRQQMQQVFARKTKQIIHKTRFELTKQGVEQKRRIMKQLMDSNGAKKEYTIQSQ